MTTRISSVGFWSALLLTAIALTSAGCTSIPPNAPMTPDQLVPRARRPAPAPLPSAKRTWVYAHAQVRAPWTPVPTRIPRAATVRVSAPAAEVRVLPVALRAPSATPVRTATRDLPFRVRWESSDLEPPARPVLTTDELLERMRRGSR